MGFLSKSIGILTAAGCILFLGGNAFAGGSESVAYRIDTTVTMIAQVSAQSKVELQAHSDDVNLMSQLGWFGDPDTGFRRQYSVSMPLQIDGKAYSSSEGKLSVNLLPGKHTLSYKGVDGADHTQELMVTLGNDSYRLQQTIDFADFMKSMDGQSGGAVAAGASPSTDPGDPYSGGHNGEFGPYIEPPQTGAAPETYYTYSNLAYVTCNRFNGSNGNQRYYEDHMYYRAIINFAGSDCDSAASWHCFSDYTSSRYCQNWNVDYRSSARCSLLIGHRPLYHAHYN